MAQTSGINHLGLTVKNLQDSTRFFVEVLGWVESGRDAAYPRTAVSDGAVRLTLWQVDTSSPINEFDRRHNIGLHHVALNVDSHERLLALAQTVDSYPGVTVEFAPELLGAGPRMHMMLSEPGGNRIEFIWSGT